MAATATLRSLSASRLLLLRLSSSSAARLPLTRRVLGLSDFALTTSRLSMWTAQTSTELLARQPGMVWESRRHASKQTKSQVKDRVMSVCKAFDKITAEKDLGLDSLDHVELVMAVEDEFGFEIPDDHAEKLLTPAKIAQYVSDHEDIKE